MSSRNLPTGPYDSEWNHRQYDGLRRQYVETLTTLAAYLEDVHGYDRERAAEQARISLDQVLRRHFVLTRGKRPGVTRGGPLALPPGTLPEFHRGLDELSSLDQSGQAPADATALLKRLLLDGANGRLIRRMIDLGADLIEPEGADEYTPKKEGVVFFALGNESQLRTLLEAGAPVDEANDFAKTPLMYAAQYNRPDIVALLLAFGAEPNLETRKGTSCGQSIDIHGRSALMYAAENAGPEVIGLLVAQGADPAARDDHDRDMADYLSRNEVMTQDKRSEAERLLGIAK